MSYDFIPMGSGEPVHKDVTTNWSNIPEDKTEKDLEKHVAPAIRGHMKRLSGRHRHRAASRWPTSSKATSRRPVASWPTCRMQLGRTLAWDAANGQVVGDDEANKLLKRPTAPPGCTRRGEGGYTKDEVGRTKDEKLGRAAQALPRFSAPYTLSPNLYPLAYTASGSGSMPESTG